MNLTHNGGVGVTEAGVPKSDTSGEGGGTTSGGGAGGMHRVKLVRAVTSVEYHPYTGVLHRKANIIKFNSNRDLTSKGRRETRLVTKSGKTRTLDMLIGIELDGKKL